MQEPIRAPLRGNFVLLRADNLRLLLPQQDVGSATHLEPGNDPQQQRIVALSELMTLLPHRPDDRFIGATLGDSDPGITWCWNELKVLIDTELHPLPLPVSLVGPDAPVAAYVEYEGEIVYVADAAGVSRFALVKRG